MYNTINGKSLTERFIKIKIGSGWTLDDFCSHYETTEEEFKKKLEQAYYRTYVESILKKMEKNEKKKKKRVQTKNKSQIVEESDCQYSDMQMQEQKLDEVNEEKSMTDEEKIKKIDSNLQDIHRSICDKKERIQSLKNKAEQLSLRQKEREAKVKAIYCQLKLIQEDDEKDKAEFENTKSRINKLQGQINGLNKEAFHLQESKRKLQAVVIKVSKSEDKSENIEVQNYMDDFSELLNGWEQKATEIFLNFNNTSYDVLDRAQIRILSKIHQIVSNLEKKGLKYKLEIEDEDVRFAFQNA